MKAYSYIKAILSGLCWGLGQLLNRQYIKALFFFVFFAALIGIEVGTSNYGEVTDPYSKIEADDLDSSFFTSWNNYYDTSLKLRESGVTEDSLAKADPDFESFLKNLEDTGTEFNQAEGIRFLTEQLTKSSPSTYKDITATYETIINKEDMDESNLIASPTGVNFYAVDGKYYINPNEQKTKDLFYFLEIDPITMSVKSETKVDYTDSAVKYRKTSNIIKDRLKKTYNFELIKYSSAGSTLEDKIYFDIKSNTIKEYDSSLFTKIENNDFEYITSDYKKIYTYYEAGSMVNGKYISYNSNVSLDNFRLFLANQFSNHISNIYTSRQIKKFLVRLTLNLNPVLKEDFETRLDNFYYDKAGLFVKSYWSVITLGSTDDVSIKEYQAFESVLIPNGVEDLSIDDEAIITGHVSVYVLLSGLIGIILSLFFFVFGIWSIVDAYHVSEQKRKKESYEKGLNWFKKTYEKDFEYIILSPAIFVVAFISIMPIVFGFILAFTNISGSTAYSSNFDYVGFRNFAEIFNFSGVLGSTFGKSFWKVLSWTVIWAIFSTATCFFGGLFQALIINSKHVVFKKAWRSILILPWAIPALLSQMVFSVMFKETGFVNQIFQNLGFYDLFRMQGILGTNANPLDYSQLDSLRQFFYLGKANIEWFSNTYNTKFVRTTLIVVNLWLGFPYFMALMSGVMTSIDKTLYEAADIDGATGAQKIWKITFPLVLQSTAPILIMTFSGNFNNFGVIYFITQGGPNTGDAARGFAGDTDILISWMYKLTVDYDIFNMASVFSVLIFLFVGSISAWNLSRTRAFSEDE